MVSSVCSHRSPECIHQLVFSTFTSFDRNVLRIARYLWSLFSVIVPKPAQSTTLSCGYCPNYTWAYPLSVPPPRSGTERTLSWFRDDHREETQCRILGTKKKEKFKLKVRTKFWFTNLRNPTREICRTAKISDFLKCVTAHALTTKAQPLNFKMMHMSEARQLKAYTEP